MIFFSKKQLTESMDALPYEVQMLLFTPEIEHKVQKIGFDAGLLIEQLKPFNSLVNFAIMNLVSRKEIASVIEKDLNLTQKISEELAANVSREIFSSIEAVKAQAKKERALYEENKGEVSENIGEVAETTLVINEPVVETPRSQIAHMADIAPDNLPTGETESFLPNLAPKTSASAEEPGHPFEEKMKRVFTAGQQSLGDLAIETTPPPAPEAPKTPPAYQADPYREPIE